MAQKPRPRTVYQIATCERLLGRVTRARKDYRRALAMNDGLDDIPPDVAADVKVVLAALEKRVARLHLTLQPEHAKLSVDGAPVELVGLVDGESVLVAHTLAPSNEGSWTPIGPFTVEVDPGTRVLTVSETEYYTAARVFTFEDGQERTAQIGLTQPPAPPPDLGPMRRKRSMGYGFAVASSAFLLTSVFFGLRALSKDKDAESHCTSGFCDATGLSLGADARRSARIADFALGFGLASAGLSAYLFVRASDGVPTVSATVHPLVGGGGLSLSAVW